MNNEKEGFESQRQDFSFPLKKKGYISPELTILDMKATETRVDQDGRLLTGS